MVRIVRGLVEQRLARTRVDKRTGESSTSQQRPEDGR